VIACQLIPRSEKAHPGSSKKGHIFYGICVGLGAKVHRPARVLLGMRRRKFSQEKL
jgi:hypothetical protein